MRTCEIIHVGPEDAPAGTLGIGVGLAALRALGLVFDQRLAAGTFLKQHASLPVAILRCSSSTVREGPRSAV